MVDAEIDQLVARQADERKQLFTPSPTKEEMTRMALEELYAKHPIRIICDPSTRWQVKETCTDQGMSGSVICAVCRTGTDECKEHIVKRMQECLPGPHRCYREWILTALAGQLGIGPRVVDAWASPGGGRLDETKTENVCMVMERVPGVTLKTWLQGKKPGQWDETWRRVGTAIRRMHDHGIVHHDLHLGNIMVSEDGLTVWIIDFGEAEYMGRGRRVSSTARHEDIGSLQAFADEHKPLSTKGWITERETSLEQHASAGQHTNVNEDALSSISWDANKQHLSVSLRQRRPSLVAFLYSLVRSIGRF